MICQTLDLKLEIPLVRHSVLHALAAVIAAAFSLTLPVASAHAQGMVAPKGSYLQSCSSVKYAMPVLIADCPPPHSDGEFVTAHPTSLDTSNCDPKGDIWSSQGYLTCIAKPGKANARAVPGGSYIQSCVTPYVDKNILMAKCDGHQASLNLKPCDTGQGIDNINGQLTCAPGAQSVATPQAQAMSPADVLKAAGCQSFLGRSNEFQCPSDAGFKQCLSYLASGQVKTCHEPGKLSSDCQQFLGRATEYTCSSEPAYQQCESFKAQGKVTVCYGAGHLSDDCLHVPGTNNGYVCSTPLSLSMCQAAMTKNLLINGKPVGSCVKKN